MSSTDSGTPSPPSTHPSATSLVRAATGNSVSSKQIGIVVGIVSLVAGAVATFIVTMYGSWNDDLKDANAELRTDHAAVVEQMREDHQLAATARDAMWTERLDDLKEDRAALRTLLQESLGRELRVALPPEEEEDRRRR